MQQPIEQHVSTVRANKLVTMRFVPYITFAAAVAATLFAIFTLPAWAEAYAWHHAAQHVIIFVSGSVAGVSVFGTRKNRKDI